MFRIAWCAAYSPEDFSLKPTLCSLFSKSLGCNVRAGGSGHWEENCGTARSSSSPRCIERVSAS